MRHMRPDMLLNNHVHEAIDGPACRCDQMQRRRAVRPCRQRFLNRGDLTGDTAHPLQEFIIAVGQMSHSIPPYPIYGGAAIAINWKTDTLKGLVFSLYIHHSGYMESKTAISALGALAQTTRLDAFRLLVRHEPDGLAAGEIARALAVPQNTMSVHLATLSRAGLIRSERRSRIINYRADLDQLKALTLFLVKDCCGDTAELCEPLIAELFPCC